MILIFGSLGAYSPPTHPYLWTKGVECTAVLIFLAMLSSRRGVRASSSSEPCLQKIGFLTASVRGSASPLLSWFMLASWRLCACCLLLLSPVRSSLSHCDAVPPPMAVTYRRTTVRRAFRYLSIIVKTNYGGGVVGGLHGNTCAASHLVITIG